MSRLAHLIVTPPEAKPFTHMLDKNEVTAGRDLTADMTIEDTLLSRVHFRFVLQNDRWHVQDDGSRNGTFVNGKRVQKGERIPLENGASISAGLTKIAFSMGERSMDAPPLHRVTRPTEDYFSIAELVAEKPNDVPAALTRLLIRVSEELLPERIPERVLRAACTMSVSFLGAQSVSVQRLRNDGTTEPLVFAGMAPRALAAGELSALIEHRGARMLRDAKGKRLVIALDAPRQSVLVADVPNDVEDHKLKLAVAIGALTSGIYDSAVSHSDLRKDNQRLLDQVRVGFAYDIDTPACLAGSSVGAQKLREAIEKASKSDEPPDLRGRTRRWQRAACPSCACTVKTCRRTLHRH
jgi:pSer/pThr/pTyr-binding forkhead associated (FHA) protein